MGARVVKTAIAATIAMLAAGALELQFAASAGLLAVLGVDVTRKRSLVSVSQRIAASVLGIVFASLIFMVLGYYPWSFGIFILLAYPLLSRAGLKDGIVTGSVVALHLYTAQTHTTAAIWNEIALLFIGLGSATIINFMYMPKAENVLQGLKGKVESSFSSIFIHIARHLTDHRYVWDGREFIEAGDAVGEGVRKAFTLGENSLLRTDEQWLVYFQMRRQQLESISRMLDLLSQVYEILPYGIMLSELFTELSEDVKSFYYTGKVEARLEQLEQSYKSMPLPETRAEFEIRSAVLQLCVELKHYLSIAKSKKKKEERNEGGLLTDDS